MDSAAVLGAPGLVGSSQATGLGSSSRTESIPGGHAACAVHVATGSSRAGSGDGARRELYRASRIFHVRAARAVATNRQPDGKNVLENHHCKRVFEERHPEALRRSLG